MTPIVHFVRFANLHDEHYENAAKVFGEPAFVHRLWDRRAQRDIAPGDLVVFAKGNADQALSPFNGNDEYYHEMGDR